LGPGSGYQLILANYLAGAFHQGAQDVKGAAAEPHRLVALQQETLCHDEAERSKRDHACVHATVSPSTSLFTEFYLTGPEIGPCATSLGLWRISPTVKSHVKNVSSELAVRTRSEAASRAGLLAASFHNTMDSVAN
jgi:hypothetical protein